MSKPTFNRITARLADRPIERKRSKPLSSEQIAITHYTSEELQSAYAYQKAILNQPALHSQGVTQEQEQ